MFLEFCASPFIPVRKLDITSRVDRYAVFFHKLEQHFSAPNGINQEALLQVFSVDELRRDQLVVRFLVERLQLSWQMHLLKVHSEQRLIQQCFVQWSSEPWIADLEQYASVLLNRTKRPLSLGTIRNYVNAAGRLLKSSKSQCARDLNQKTFNNYLKRSAGSRASLSAFLVFLRSHYSVDLQLGQKPVSNLSLLGYITFRDLRWYTQQLKKIEKAGERRAFIAALLSKLYQVPLKEVLLLRKTDFSILKGEITMHVNSLNLSLEPRIDELVAPLLNQPGNLLFPGRNGFQSLSHSGVDYVLKRKRKTPQNNSIALL